jgi:hypothetical protein
MCEGLKTEPNYFDGLRTFYRLASANVKISGRGNDPLSVVESAIDELERDEDLNRAYCVFDRDGHATYDAALRRVAESEFGRTDRLFAVESVPCFELWILLHYVYSTRAYAQAGQRSACEQVMIELKGYLPEYTKGHQSIFDQLSAKLGDAMRHANQLERHNLSTGSVNPATKVHKLVDYLIRLKQPMATKRPSRNK